MESIILTIIMLIVTAAFGALGKKQQGHKPQRPRGGIPGMPTFGGPDIESPRSDHSNPYERPFEESYDPPTDIRQFEQPMMSSSPKDVPSSNTYSAQAEPTGIDGSNRGSHDATQARRAARQPDDRRRELTPASSGDDTRSPSASHPLLDPQHIMNGIIWSEILSKPRSRRNGLR